MTQTIATKDAVVATAEAIEGEGGPVTLDAVLDRLGGGSRSTIARHVRMWRSERGRSARSQPAAPAYLVELAEPLLVKLADAAQSEARREHERIERILARQTEELSDELERESAEVERLAAELVAANDQVQVLTATVQTLEAKLRDEEAARLEGVRQLAAEKQAHLETRERLDKAGGLEFATDMIDRMRALEERIAATFQVQEQGAEEGV